MVKTDFRSPNKNQYRTNLSNIVLVQVRVMRKVQDTHYVDYIKGIGRIYRRTLIGTCDKVAFAKLVEIARTLWWPPRCAP
jgi:hypothetical protein